MGHLRHLFEAGDSYAGNLIRAARQKSGIAFLNDAAEAKWCYGILMKEWSLIQWRKNAGWWDNETVPVLMQTELKSHTNFLVQRYGREW